MFGMPRVHITLLHIGMHCRGRPGLAFHLAQRCAGRPEALGSKNQAQHKCQQGRFHLARITPAERKNQFE